MQMWKKKWKIGIAAVVSILSFLMVVYRYDLLSFSPMQTTYALESVSRAVGSTSGNSYVIDQGKRVILQLDRDMKLQKCYYGGSRDGDFYYAYHVAEDSHGDVFVVDGIYGEQGNRVTNERIIWLSRDGRKILQDMDYSADGNYPMQYGRILDFRYQDGAIYYLYRTTSTLDLYRIGEDHAIEQISSVNCNPDLNDAAYDAESNTITILTRQGAVGMRSVSTSGGWMYYPDYMAEAQPFRVSAADGHAYFVDLVLGTLLRAPLADADVVRETAPETVLADTYGASLVSVKEGGKEVYLSDQADFGVLQTETMSFTEYPEVSIGFYPLVLLAWACAAITGLVLFVLLMLFLRWAILQMIGGKDKQSLLRIVLVAFSSVAVASVVSYMYVSRMVDDNTQAVYNRMRFASGMMASQIDADDVNEIGSSVANYHNEEFNRMRRTLDPYVEAGYEQGLYLYYAVCVVRDDLVYAVTDYEDTVPCGYLYEEYPGSYTEQAMVTGEPVLVTGEVSTYGNWMFIKEPVRDKNGKVGAVLEVGTNADQLVNDRKNLIYNSVASVFSTSVVIVMMILEFVFALNFYEKKRQTAAESLDSTMVVPIRLMVALCYMVDSTQDVFVAILCERLYNRMNGAGIAALLPEGIAIALPISIQLLMAAVASVFGGRLAEKIQPKKSMFLGFFVEAAGFLICATLGEFYLGILVGKVFAGLGLGLVYISANTMAAYGKTADNSGQAFADVSAGVVSGLTIGVGLGSVLLGIGDFHLVYGVGFLFLLCGAVLCFVTKTPESAIVAKAAASEELDVAEVVNTKHISTFAFLRDRRVISFMLLLLVPFMICLSFREYMFPLFASELGWDEVKIGQAFLIFGLAAVYAGPALSRKILDGMGARRAVIVSSLALGVSMLLFAIWPSMPILLLSVCLLVLITSFAMTCQYAYFESVPASVLYGEGGAMGIYSMFESLGQTAGPMVYGAALVLGFAKGAGVVAVALLAFAVCFALLNRKEKNVGK